MNRRPGIGSRAPPQHSNGERIQRQAALSEIALLRFRAISQWCNGGRKGKQAAEHRSGRLATSKSRSPKRGSHALRFALCLLLLCHNVTPSGLMRRTLKNNRALLMKRRMNRLWQLKSPRSAPPCSSLRAIARRELAPSPAPPRTFSMSGSSHEMD